MGPNVFNCFPHHRMLIVCRSCLYCIIEGHYCLPALFALAGKKKKYWSGTTSPSEPTDFPLVDITASNIRELKVTAQREVVRLFHQFDEVGPFSFQTTLQQICNPAFCYDTPKDASYSGLNIRTPSKYTVFQLYVARL